MNHRRARLCVSVLATVLMGASITTAGAATPADDASAAERLGDVTGFAADGDDYTVSSGQAKLRISFQDDGLFRVHLAPDGRFTDPANDDPSDPKAPDADIVVKRDYKGAGSTYAESREAYVIRTDEATLTVSKSPLTLKLADEDGRELWRESAPLAWSEEGTVQSLAQGAKEQFFGGGMQNGRFSHRDQSIDIDRDYNWNDGGNPNAVPFYVSSQGYGVLRNTFAPGRYDFRSPVRTTHDEQRFDAYYFVGDAKQVIADYTELTGRPAMMPMYALEVGDADCYLHNANRGERKTLRDATKVADGYAEHGMPLGWMLVNDGYGCGYEDLAKTGDMLHGNGGELGLWTESDLTEQESEVGAGVRVRKTDVAWVGPGYRFALDACEKSQSGIEQHSADRATVMTIEGWAGTQRCGAMWSGDQSGSWDYIRWQIPTYAGSTMSGQHMTTGDIDGIFGGSAETYVRDLQWKMLLPMTYSMSGWAASDKQPWRYGEPYTAINKKYMLLHERLLPYFYTHSANASANGVGPTRPLYLNYPSDPATWGDKAKYEFLAGDDFLVAPVYEDSTVRDGIYLPEGRWVDYWTGRVYEGKQTIDGYQAPLDTLPLFVRAGAVVPMFPEGTTDWKQGKDAGRLDLDIYPQSRSSFTLYEDDGRTRAHADGASATQKIDVSAPGARRSGTVDITVGALKGTYEGKPTERRYGLTVHTDDRPSGVTVEGKRLTKAASAARLEAAESGWYYDAGTGVVHVKTAEAPTAAALKVRITGAASVGGKHPEDRDVRLDASAPAIASIGEPQQVTTSFTNSTGKPVKVTGTAVTAPEGWTVQADGPTTAEELESGKTFTARFTVTAPKDAEPGTFELSASSSYATRNAAYAVGSRTGTTLAHASVEAAADNVGVTREAAPQAGNLDGGGSSFIAERLAEAGVSPGATVSANGFTFTWPDAEPGTPDNATGKGQSIKVTGTEKGNALAFLGTGTSGTADGKVTVHYTDGSTTEATLGFPNWCCLPADKYGAKTAVSTKGKNTQSGPAYPTVDYRLYTKTVRIDPAKQVAAVTLPNNGTVHVFAMSVGHEEIAPAPLPDGQYALANGTESGLLLEAPGDTNAGGLKVGEPSASPTQKWNVTRNDDGSYQLKNAGSGLCADVASSSTTSGAQVVQYTCTGTPNQNWVVTNDSGALTIKAKHSGLSLAATAAGPVVQVTDTGAASQRWRAKGA